MHRLATIGISLAMMTATSGCVVAAIPMLAAGAVVRTQTDPPAGDGDHQIVMDRTASAGPREPILDRSSAMIPPLSSAGIAAPVSTPPAAMPGGTLTADSDYGRFVSHVVGRARLVEEGAPVASLVLANGLLAREPEYVRCIRQRAAVVIDLDDGREDAATTFEPGGAVQVLPEMLAALATVRAAGVDVLWITDNRTSSRASIAAQLQSTGLDPAGLDLVLTPESPADRKQLRRLRAAATHCIVAVVGDRRSDADEVYDYLRDPTTPLVIDANWDAGWFILPPPLTAAPTRTGEE